MPKWDELINLTPIPVIVVRLKRTALALSLSETAANYTRINNKWFARQKPHAQSARKRIQTVEVTKTAQMVPTGMENCGLARSPERLDPAIKPKKNNTNPQ